MARLPRPPATWTPCLHTQDGVELPRGWRLILCKAECTKIKRFAQLLLVYILTQSGLVLTIKRTQAKVKPNRSKNKNNNNKNLTLLPSLVFLTLHVPSESFSKNFLAFGARSIMWLGGIPRTSTILFIWSTWKKMNQLSYCIILNVCLQLNVIKCYLGMTSLSKCFGSGMWPTTEGVNLKSWQLSVEWHI